MGIGDLLAQISGEPSSSSQGILPSPSLKRNAEGDFKRSSDKIARPVSVAADTSRPIAQIKRPHLSSIQSAQLKNNSPLSAGASAAASTSSKFQKVSSRDGTPATAIKVDNVSAKPPKKGSFAEIMARGKVAHATLGPVGKIQHKAIKSTISPVSKREKQDEKDQKRGSSQEAAKRLKGKPGRQFPLDSGRESNKEHSGKTTKSVPSVVEKRPKKSITATTGYTGTARPNLTLAKSKSTSDSRSSIPSGRGYPPPSHRYNYASDEEDEDEEDEEEDDYASDVSSDMEAAAFEVDEEEEMASLIARREDAEALREENRLKREKEERKRRFAAMAEARR